MEESNHLYCTMQAGGAEAQLSLDTGNVGDNTGYRVLTSGLFTSHRCPWNSLRDEITFIWQEQRHHVKFLQDPPSVQLYTETARLVVGAVSLPVYRCTRESSSLQIHLAW